MSRFARFRVINPETRRSLRLADKLQQRRVIDLPTVLHTVGPWFRIWQAGQRSRVAERQKSSKFMD